MYPLKYNHSHSWRKIKKGVSYECSYGKCTWHWNFLRTLARYRFSSWTCYLDGLRRLYFLFLSRMWKTGFIKSMCSNYVGLLWGMCIIMSGNINSGILFGAIVTGAFSWLICYQSKIDLLSLVPNTFMGGFSAFASGGDWKMLCICLFLGNILGVCCDYSGRFLAAKFGKDN